MFQGALDERQATLGLFAHQLFAIAAIPLDVVKFVGNRQSRQHRDFLRVHGLRYVGTYFPSSSPWMEYTCPKICTFIGPLMVLYA